MILGFEKCYIEGRSVYKTQVILQLEFPMDVKILARLGPQYCEKDLVLNEKQICMDNWAD